MWQLVNRTPYHADRGFVRDRQGAEVWIVAVKASFRLRADGVTDSEDLLEKVTCAPKYRGQPAHSSLVYESDLVLKVGTDVILNGSAHAPDGRPVTQLDVQMAIGERKKDLRVFGERTWNRAVGRAFLSDPEPFVTKPITYENAFGGRQPLDERNPAGTGYARSTDDIWGRRAANVEHPRQLISSWRDHPAPAGFGAIARHWSPRRELAGSYDQRWESDRAPLPPNDLDERFYMCAPVDQQFDGYLRGGEPVTLVNLVPGCSLVRFTLPKIALAFETRLGSKIIRHRADLTTVIIEPDTSRLLMVWCTGLPCHGCEHMLEKTVVLEKRILSWERSRGGT